MRKFLAVFEKNVKVKFTDTLQATVPNSASKGQFVQKFKITWVLLWNCYFLLILGVLSTLGEFQKNWRYEDRFMHALHFLMISRGKSSQNQRISSLDGLKSLKTALNQYVEEKKSCLIFNFRLETCVTSGKWSPGRSTRAPGRKIFEII